MTLVTTSTTSNVNPSAAEQQTLENQQQGEPILGKFADQDALIAAYQELEARLGNGQQQQTTTNTTTGNEQQVQQPTDQSGQEAAAQTALASAGIDFEALSTEFATDGKLSDQSIEKLTKAGFTQDVIDGYIEGAVARAEKIETEIYGGHGGFDEVQKALDWAAANLSVADQNALNTQFAAKDKATVKTGVDALMGRYKAANPPAPALNMGGGNNTGPSVKAFSSQAEMTKFVSDPRYGRDEAFTNDYNRRLMATDFSKLR